MKERSKRCSLKSRPGVLGILFLAALVAAVLSFSPVARATPLGLNLLPFPDIASTSIDVVYNAGSDLFTADGAAVSLNLGGGPLNITGGGLFDLDAMIDGSGVLTGGTLTITGTVGTTFTGGTLLTGTLTDFGFIDPPGGDIFEFLFNVTGGDLAASFGPLGGVILDAAFPSSDFDGTFTANFDNLGSGGAGFGAGVSDTAPVPEPATLSLMLLGGGGLFAIRRRKKA